jgi:hypothetical protein
MRLWMSRIQGEGRPLARGAGEGKPWRGGHQGFVLSDNRLGLMAEGHGMDPSRPLLAPIERIAPGVPEDDNLVQELALVL